MLRIFPLYYAYLAVLFLAVPLLLPSLDVKPETQGWLWTYLGNVLFAREGGFQASPYAAHFWSLAVEEQFYLAWPVLVWVLPRRRLALALPGARGRRLRAPPGNPPHHLQRHGRLRPHPGPDGRAGPGGARRRRGAGAGLVAAGAPGRALAARRLGRRRGRGLGPAGRPLRRGPGGAGLGLRPARRGVRGAARAGPRRRGGLAALPDAPERPLRGAGKYSYGLYVLHYPIFLALEAAGFTSLALAGATGSRLLGVLAFAAVAGLATFAAALLSWNLLEKRFLRWKDRVPYREPAARVGSPFEAVALPGARR